MKKTKKAGILFSALCLFCVLSALPVSAKSKGVPRRLMLGRKEITLYVGESRKLMVEKVKPAGASEKVSWKSKKRNVASVSRNGKVNAKRPGKATIVAVSKKNPSVQAAVQVFVKKLPVKKEKTCIASGKFYKSGDAGMLCFYYRRTFSDKHLRDKIVIRSSEDFQEMKKIWKKNAHTDFRKTCLAEYENMDFKRESLVLLHYAMSPQAYDVRMNSLTTKFDASGKLSGILDISSKVEEIPPGIYVPAVLENYTLVLQLDKKDEAMIDYYRQ